MMCPTRGARFKRRFVGIRPWVRHGLVLMVAGLVYIGVGVSYILSEPTPNRERALVVALDKAPIEFWGTVFVLVGTLSVISSRWPPVAEKWGYMVLTGLSGGWSSTYATGVIFEHSPVSNISSALTWGLLGFLWWAVSGLVNPGQAVVIIEHVEAEEGVAEQGEEGDDAGPG